MSLSRDRVVLEPWHETYAEGLRAACAEDNAIWEIYPICLSGEHFDASLDNFLSRPNWIHFVVLDGDRVVGMTNFINPDAKNGVVEIGGTYIAPSVRGSGFNRMMKTLMIEHAFAQGYRRIELRVDLRNTRSQRAVEKLGAVREGVLRKNMITWTGHLRDTVVFGLLKDEWVAVR
ncbi:GNAT family N-acetyltransferase [Sphingomonas cavernae]|uniref:GNAT family N-acetyltransferase n=1 Tax=Sphingomonas cavernae TaxID=2320861 RepID=UPI001EE621F2|nr:GNAT family protein [Sphingomonas cavernae]